MQDQGISTEQEKPDLIELLKSFNRKERYFLVRHALGNFRLSDDFRRELGEEINLEILRCAFTAMDYHLDWLVAALFAYQRGGIDDLFQNSPQGIIKGTNEDSDLLVAFVGDGQYHLVLIEAKADGSWDNNQMRSKSGRLRQIFGCDGDRHPGVVPHFCLMSPGRPEKLDSSEWPEWMSRNNGSYYWIEMQFPTERLTVTVCDKDGRDLRNGNSFRIDKA